MKIFGKSLGEYLRFQAPVVTLVLGVGIMRLVLSLTGVPNSTAKWASITTAALLGVVYYGIAVHKQGFGGYRHLLALVVIQSVAVQGLIIAAIALGIATGQDNIYTAPEYSVNPSTGESGIEGKTWSHAGGHAFFGIVVGSLVSWAIGSLVLALSRRLVRRGGAVSTSAAR